VHGAAGFCFSRFKGAFLHVKTGIFREEGRVDIQDSPGKRIHEGILENPHEPGKANEFGPAATDALDPTKFRFWSEDGFFRPGIEEFGWNPEFAGGGDTRSLLLV
jgi:hypothetical protein